MSWGVAPRNGVGLGLGAVPSVLNAPPYAAVKFLFAETGVLDSRITFTRASSGTYFDSTGTLQTATTDVPRFDYNPSTLAPLGLLIEEQRTNLCLYSEDLNRVDWVKGANVTTTYNTTVAPDGATTGDTLTIGGSNNGVYQSITVTASTNYTWSWWVKLGTLAAADFKFAIYNNTAAGWIAQDVAPTQTPNSIGWTRITYSFATPVGCTSIRVYVFRNFSVTAGTVNVWGMQLEAGAFSTSYIATEATALTRSDDVATVTGTNFSSWYLQGVGSIFAEYDSSNVAKNNNVASISDGTLANRITLRATNASSQSAFAGVDAGVTQWALTIAGAAINTLTKACGAYATNNIAVSRSGGTVATDTVATISTAVDRLILGADGDGTSLLNGHIKSFAYYPLRLSDSDLRGLTA